MNRVRYRLTITVSCLALLALARSASAAPDDVRNTKHNFTSASASPNAYFFGASRVCVFCHTVHNGGSEAPLWNHQTNTSQSYQLYTSPTLDMTPVTLHNGSYVCLSCHDGTIAVNSLNALAGEPGLPPYSYGTPGGAGLDGTGKLLSSADGFVGTDLTDDHPVGITYDTDKDNDFVPKTGVATSYPDKLLSNGLYVECVSCHDPHNNTYSYFLVESNANSNLCTRCHIK